MAQAGRGSFDDSPNFIEAKMFSAEGPSIRITELRCLGSPSSLAVLIVDLKILHVIRGSNRHYY